MAEKALPKMTPKQAAFVAEYLSNGLNASAAYRATYDASGLAETVRTSACRLLQTPAVAAAVAEAEAAAAVAQSAVVAKYSLDKAAAVDLLCQMALYNVSDVFEWDATGPRLKPSDQVPAPAKVAISEVRRSQDGHVTLKFADRRAAIMDLAKLQGWIIDKSQMVGRDGNPVDPGGTVMLIDMGNGPRTVAELAAERDRAQGR